MIAALSCFCACVTVNESSCLSLRDLNKLVECLSGDLADGGDAARVPVDIAQVTVELHKMLCLMSCWRTRFRNGGLGSTHVAQLGTLCRVCLPVLCSTWLSVSARPNGDVSPCDHQRNHVTA